MKTLTILTVFMLLCFNLTYSRENLDVIFSDNVNNNAPRLESGYYVVIGAYAASKEYYAKLYNQKVNSMGYESAYGFSEKRNLYFVYLRYTQNYRESITKMREARKIGEFSEAWVFVALEPQELSADAEKVEEVSKVMKNEVVDGLDKMYAEKFDGTEQLEETDKDFEIVETGRQQEMKAGVSEEDAIADNEVPRELDKSTEVALSDIVINKPNPKRIESLADVSLFFNLFNARNHRDVTGEIQIIDAERAKLLKVIKGGEYVQLPDPQNGTGNLLLICDVFGYRKSQQSINYYNPLPDTLEQNINLIADVYAINFDLIRYHKGDIATMYNVYFFKDAAVMRPESKFEVNNLLNMMKDNPGYKIKIHGHVNGKHAGKIISKGDSNDFFALADENNEGFGSAVDLSKQRAELIRDYLILNGVEEDRMEIKAWGGKRMLHDKHSNMAKHNVRVEIEILEE